LLLAWFEDAHGPGTETWGGGEEHFVPQREAITQGGTMLYWALMFLIVAIIAAIFGFGGIAVAAAGIAKILFFIFLVLFVIMLITHLGRRGSSIWPRRR
jgi:uncharacterized membrane protein YtjA (UPF0391 family)